MEAESRTKRIDLPQDAKALDEMQLEYISMLSGVIFPRLPSQSDASALSKVSNVPSQNMPPAHDPKLRHQLSAVQLLGRFSHPEAVAVLGKLLLADSTPTGIGMIERLWKAEDDVAQQWLRDTALLTLLQSNCLPSRKVDELLREVYSFSRNFWPWQRKRVIDELPLLFRYKKQRIFYNAFLKPASLLMLALALVIVFIQVSVFQLGTLGDISTRNDSVFAAALLALGATGLVLDLLHRATTLTVLGVFAAGGSPLGYYGGKVTTNVKKKRWAVLMVTVIVILAIACWSILSGQFAEARSTDWYALVIATVVLAGTPLLLQRASMYARDVELFEHFAQTPTIRWNHLLAKTSGKNTFLNILVIVLALPFILLGRILKPSRKKFTSLVTFVTYTLMPVFVAAGIRAWDLPLDNLIFYVIYLLYLFALPFFQVLVARYRPRVTTWIRRKWRLWSYELRVRFSRFRYG